jgi:hypothetical protein
MTQCERLERIMKCGGWYDNFSLYRYLYGNAPCGRLSARIYDLQHMHGHTIERQTDAQRLGRTMDRARVWYRLVRASA